MITKQLKTKAMGMLKGGASVNEVAGELDLPLSLVSEWKAEASIDVIDSIEATNYAMSRLLQSDLVNDEDVVDRIRARLENVAETLATQIEIAVLNTDTDIGRAQVLKACSESAVKLYTAFVLTRNIGSSGHLDNLSNTSVSTFQALLKD